MRPRPTLLYRAYVAAASIALPFVKTSVLRKVTQHGVSQDRAREKLGYATQTRPDGMVIWFHAASVGETMSVISLITRIGERLPNAEFLITSGTATSAETLAKRMPARTRHQFAPLDAPGPVGRFLEHWRPDAAILVESELWPHMLMRSQSVGIPLALVNARLSKGSVRQWQRFSKTAAMLFGTFRLILAQSDAMVRSLVDLGAPQDHVRKGANLKALATPLPQDEATVAQMHTALKGRPVWVAASTHEGEEDIVLDAHAQLLKAFPDLCLILVPRHPERSSDVVSLIKGHGWAAPRRAQSALPDGPVFLADTVGELGTWYALTDVVFLGGSLKPIGGHNPFEPALTDSAVCSGTHVTNFQDTFDAMIAAGGVTYVHDAGSLCAQVTLWLTDKAALNSAKRAARDFCDGQTGALDEIATDLIHALELTDA